MVSSIIKKKLLTVVKKRQKLIDSNIKIQKKYLKTNKNYRELYNEHVGGYTDEMNYKEINKYMYGGYVEFDTEGYVIPNIDGIFKVFKEIPKITNKITTFRLSDYKINSKLFIPAFTSTSYKLSFMEDVKENQSIIDIVIPKGSKGIIASESVYYKSEKEILLPPGYYELVNESVKIMYGKKVNYYKIKVKKQILTFKDWLKHLEMNEISLEDFDYFEEEIEKLNKPKKKTPMVVKKKTLNPIKKPNKIKLKKKKIKIKKRKIVIKRRKL